MMKYFAVRPGVFFGGEEGLCVTMGKRFFFLKVPDNNCTVSESGTRETSEC